MVRFWKFFPVCTAFYKYHKHYFQNLGHLNGKLDRHFTPEACPVYHNTTKKWCQTFKNEVNKKNNTRKKALTLSATKSPLGSPSNEQKRHADQVCLYLFIQFQRFSNVIS